MRTLEQLLKAQTSAKLPIISVSAEEGRLLGATGASVSNGLRMHSDGEGGSPTQTYRLGDKEFKWFGHHEDAYPIQ